jgi:S-DNA-T family DNA segregation ATPase FtsK/SpoIIIE
MGISLEGKVSADDIQRVNDIRNHPQYEQGFESDFSFSGDNSDFSSGDSFSDMFSDGGGLDDLFGDGGSSGGSSSGFGQTSSGFDDVFGGQSSGGGFGFGGTGAQSTTFGSSGFNSGGAFASGGFNSPFSNSANQQTQQVQPDAMDKALDSFIDTSKTIGSILMEMINSIKLRNCDDFGYLSRNMIIAGGAMVPAGIAVGILGTIIGIYFLSFKGLPLHISLAGALSFTFGLGGIGVSALILEKQGEAEPNTTDVITEIPPSDDNVTQQYEDNIGDELDDLFGDDFDDIFNDSSSSIASAEPEEPEEEFVPKDDDVVDTLAALRKELDAVEENRVISRETLFDTFKPMLPTCTPDFSTVKNIEPNTSEFQTLETICLKALSNLANVQLEELDSSLESASENFFSYELRLKRINKVKKTDDLAREIEAYMRSGPKDTSVNAEVAIEGDFYKIVVTKGVSTVVTFGDIFRQEKCCQFFRDKSNKLPIITGIDEVGNIMLDDAKAFDTMLIAGKPRSGKSWYVLSILMSFMLFNSPEDVQFCIIDPKESNLFKTISLMPHVFGLHNDSRILNIFDDIIEIEAPRRKKLLDANRCDDIWALRKKGIQLPLLYIVIDEFMSVIGNIEKEQKEEFNGKLKVIISQFPSLGIRLIFVPHRATGTVDKTQRTMLQFTAAVRADKADVEDTLGITKWNRALTQPGDLAIKTSSMQEAVYARGAALTRDDGDNTLFIETAAKAFYKMGVDIPDMSNMRFAYNRDEEYIKKELGGEGNRVQYDASTIFKDIEDTDFNDLR